jgi:methylenetetrahydrofolate dehydrogenase (NADP+)/methenyltetrahydrofolate cyclohydrolase
MSATVLDGRAASREIRAEIAEQVTAIVDNGGRAPGLVAVLVGEDPASQVYVGSKRRASEKAGLVGRVIEKPADISQRDLEAVIEELNADDSIDGILVQLPLPAGLDTDRILSRVDPSKDVDGFHPESVGRLWLGQDTFAPATPSGILELLKRNDIDLVGKSAVIVGRSNIVGKPLAGLLLAEHCTVTLAHSRTRDLPGVCRAADILVGAIGRPAFFGAEHVGDGAIVIDVGINRVRDAQTVARLFPDDEVRARRLEEKGYVIVGDVDYNAALSKAAAITPVPGGVGPLTVTMLLANTVKAARLRQGIV